MSRSMIPLLLFLAAAVGEARADPPLKVGVFAVDASPPIGSPMAYDPTKGVVHPLSCRGVVLIGEGRPIVLCAVDWIGIGNDGQAEFRKALAEAAGTTAAGLRPHAAPARRAASATSRRTSARRTAGSTARSSMPASPAP